ncbi:MAG: SprB repeat-containing protein [Saprospiraceae bacterium]
MELLSGTICEGDSITIAGEVFHEQHLTDTLIFQNAAQNGCDSMLVISVDVLPTPSFSFSTTLCAGETLLIGDSLLTQSGNFEIRLADASSNGCDSLVNVSLLYAPPAEGSFSSTLCAGASITIGGTFFDENNPSGTILLAGASSNGCDSLVQVLLSFIPNSLYSLDTLLCAGATLQVGNQLFSESNPNGIVILENASATGCDSTVFVQTQYLPTLSATMGEDIAACAGQPLETVLLLTPNDSYTFTISYSNGFDLVVPNYSQSSYTIPIPFPDQSQAITLTAITSASGCPVVVLDEQTDILVSHITATLTAAMNTPNGDAISCNGFSDGSISANILEGVPPYQYNWSTGATTPSLTGLPAGAYAATITDALNCTTIAQITLTEPTAIDFAIQIESVSCLGNNTGSITIESVAGGSPPFEYSLDNVLFNSITTLPYPISNLSTGNYNLSVMDANDCINTIPLFIPDGNQLTMDLGDDSTITVGDSVLLSPFALNFTPTEWMWTPTTGLSQPESLSSYTQPTITTTYVLQLEDENGCSVSDTDSYYC